MDIVLKRLGIIIGLIGVLAGYASPAAAAIYKCTDGSGGITYSQVPCQAQDTSSTIMKSGANRSAIADCRIANNFAMRVASQMRRGQTADGAFTEYGGIDAIPKTAIGIINYVHTHKHNEKTSPARITALSSARCKSNSYGPVQCDDFPYSFIYSLGGCEAAKGMSGDAAGVQADAMQQPATGPNAMPGVSALGLRSGMSGANGMSQKCQDKLNAKLETLFDEMRKGGSANQQSQLQEQRRQIGKQLSEC